MSRIIKKAKNNTQATKKIFGKFVEPDEVYEIPANKWLDAIEDDTFKDDVLNGDVVINNGSQDLSAQDGVDHINKLVDPEQIPIKRVFYPQFQFIKEMDYSSYLVSWVDSDTQKSKLRRSGDSDGMKNGNAAPIIVPIGGTLINATLNLQGCAVDDGSPASSCEIKFELWEVGHTNEGTKIGDIIFTIDNSSGSVVGQWWNSWQYDVNLTVQKTLSLSIAAGKRLGLKFIRQQDENNKIVEARGITVGLQILEN